MNWLLSLVRIVGALFPVGASLVQVQAEIGANALEKRISSLEDPISSLHEGMPKLSREIYDRLKAEESLHLRFEESFYETHSRPLAIIDSRGFIKANHTIGTRYRNGITIIDQTYIMYMCALAEDPKKMETLIRLVDECEINENLDGNRIKITTDLPLPVIYAVFEIFAANGRGICSPSPTRCNYRGLA